MKKIISTFYLVTISFFISQALFSQENKKEQIAKAITDYFFLERENIHAHFDKNVFMTDESVWFKGYIFDRKKNVPFFNTVNIYATLMDDQGKTISTQLIYGNIGAFLGSFKLGNELKSGKYYIQFYTNWMNNFIEDESAVYEISVINQNMGAGNVLAKADPSKVNIEFRPEGGTLLFDAPNSIGISISDCNHNPLPVTAVDIVDRNGKNIKTVQINKLGHGKFDLPAISTMGYKAVVTIDDVKYEQVLPLAQPKGVSLEINNFAVAEKTIVKIRTNKNTIDSFIGKSLYILVHQDDKAAIFEINFNDNKLDRTLVIPNAEMFDGINTIRLIDSEMNELAERIIYNYPQVGLNAEIKKVGQTSESIEYTGKINCQNVNLSISVLPENTISNDESNDIFGSLLIQPYLETKNKVAGKYYFSTISKGKLYELDLYLINQKSKYKWHNILKNPPKETYTFDRGLTLKGTIPASAGDTRYAKVRLYSLTSAIDLITTVNEKREFVFNNLAIADSTYVNFTLLKKGSEPKELTLLPQLLNARQKFNKTFSPEPRCYATEASNSTLDKLNVYKEAIELEEVKIEGNALKYASSFGNAYLQGYKISDMKANMYLNLINFIKTYGGFVVDDRDGNLRILSRTVNSINGAQSGPIIYVDNVQLVDYSMLTVIQMGEVDEIYMSSTAIIPSVRNYMGVIKVYLKKGVRGKSKGDTPQIMIKNGFERITRFENIVYNTTYDKGFDNFGVVDWEPTIITDENGNFKLSIPKIYRKPVKILIEGISADGKLISEIKILDTIN